MHVARYTLNKCKETYKGIYNGNKYLIYERFILINNGKLLLNGLSSSHERTGSAHGPSMNQLIGDRCTSVAATQR